MTVFDQLMAAAQPLIGTRYSWGGTSAQGVDCSGFVQLVYGQAGIRLPRVSNEQARAGAAVTQDQARPGDLVWWDLGDRNQGADHIGIYLGDGMVMEASSGRGKVVVRKLWGDAHFTRPNGLPADGAAPGVPAAAPTAPGGTMRASDLTSFDPSGVAGGVDMKSIFNMADLDDPGETAETVGPYGWARMMLGSAATVSTPTQDPGFAEQGARSASQQDQRLPGSRVPL